MSDRSVSPVQWSVWITRLIGLWLIAGATLKLLWGNELQLPAVLRELPIEPELTYRIAVATEMCVGLLALLRPRWSWLLVIAILLLFDTVLVIQVVQGAESCGCFGGRLPIPPAAMLGVDSALLLALLISRPWSTPGSDATGGIIAIVVVVGAAVLPWAIDREARTPADLESGLFPKNPHLDVDTWVGKPLAETKLAPWVDLSALPPTALWIFYKESCPVCAGLLNHLANMENGGREIVLVRIPEEGEGHAREVHDKPEGPWVHEISLASAQWVIIPPAVLSVKDGRVMWAKEGVEGIDDFLKLDGR